MLLAFSLVVRMGRDLTVEREKKKPSNWPVVHKGSSEGVAHWLLYKVEERAQLCRYPAPQSPWSAVGKDSRGTSV